MMEKTVSAAEANRKFSRILREIRAGKTYVVTSHGRPVARIMPAHGHKEFAAEARRALLDRLEKQRVVEVGPWTRDELYGRHT